MRKLAEARRKGTRLGRSRASPIKLEAAAKRVREGASLRIAAKEYGVGTETLRRHLRRESGKAA